MKLFHLIEKLLGRRNAQTKWYHKPDFGYLTI